jgi:hypothetical protein
MKLSRQFVTLAVVMAIGITGSAQQKPAPKTDKKNPPQQNFMQPQRKPGFVPPALGGPGGGKGRHRIGSWLRENQNVPPEQQERALEQDPKFQALPPDVQKRMRERLREFNALPPEEQKRRLERMEHFREMSPEQRQRWWDFQREVRSLPEERQKPVRQAFRTLMDMSPEQRQQAIGSERFKQDFSDSERDLIARMVAEAERHRESTPPPPPPNDYL